MIRPREIRAYGSLVMAENDSTPDVGGGIDLTTAIDFLDIDVNDRLLVVSSSSLDAIQVTITGRVDGGTIETEVVTLDGITPVLTTRVWERILKVQKSGTSVGVIAVERSIPSVGSQNFQSVTDDIATLSSFASNVDQYYLGSVIRVISGPGAGYIGRVLWYYGNGREATLDSVPVGLTSSSVYRISRGLTFWKTPHEIMTVRRPFYNVVADTPGGQLREFYEKFFWRNNSSQTLELASVAEAMNPTSRVTFALESDYGGTTTAANRRTIPGLSYVFNRNLKDVPSGEILSGQSLGVWLKLTLPAGTAPIKSSYGSKLVGQTT